MSKLIRCIQFARIDIVITSFCHITSSIKQEWLLPVWSSGQGLRPCPFVEENGLLETVVIVVLDVLFDGIDGVIECILHIATVSNLQTGLFELAGDGQVAGRFGRTRAKAFAIS